MASGGGQQRLKGMNEKDQGVLIHITAQAPRKNQKSPVLMRPVPASRHLNQSGRGVPGKILKKGRKEAKKKRLSRRGGCTWIKKKNKGSGGLNKSKLETTTEKKNRHSLGDNYKKKRRWQRTHPSRVIISAKRARGIQSQRTSEKSLQTSRKDTRKGKTGKVPGPLFATREVRKIMKKKTRIQGKHGKERLFELVKRGGS